MRDNLCSLVDLMQECQSVNILHMYVQYVYLHTCVCTVYMYVYKHLCICTYINICNYGHVFNKCFHGQPSTHTYRDSHRHTQTGRQSHARIHTCMTYTYIHSTHYCIVYVLNLQVTAVEKCTDANEHILPLRLKLDPVESGLLSHLVVSGFADFTMCADVPVYLPVRSSRVPHRLVAFRLFGTCTVCLLLGPEPPLHTLISQVTRYWDIVYDSLRAEEQFYLHGSCEVRRP